MLVAMGGELGKVAQIMIDVGPDRQMLIGRSAPQRSVRQAVSFQGQRPSFLSSFAGNHELSAA